MNHYTTLELINDLIDEISSHVSIDMLAKTGTKTGKIKNESLSIILGQYPNYLSELLYLITNPSSTKYNPNYRFSIERLDSFKRNLKKYLGVNASRCIELIEKYQKANEDLKEYPKQQWNIHNPYLRKDYFRNFDTVEKGYWYGFLCADGYLQIKLTGKIRYRISFELSIKDKERLVAFCRAIGLNTNNIKERVRENIINEKLTIGHMAYVEFTCKPIAENMMKQGFLRLKDGRKNIAVFKNRKVTLGFLLGYYDGDGFEGRTDLISTNKLFLEQIKEDFMIENQIYRVGNVNDIGDPVLKEKMILSKKPIWRLALGTRIFNEMMLNYENSMPRKRKYFREDNIIYENLKKRIESKKNLRDLVYKFPKTNLAKMFRVSPPLISKLCIEWGVKGPPQGYWNKFRGKNNSDSSLLG